MPARAFSPLFPYPSLEASLHLLRGDRLYGRIPPGEAESVAVQAWEWGESIARLEAEKNDHALPIEDLIAGYGVTIMHVNEDNVRAGIRQFGEFDRTARTITLFTVSLEAWARANNRDREEAAAIALAHELFHFLEEEKYGAARQRYSVPLLRIAGMAIGKTGIPALSEIAAYGFSLTYFSLTIQEPVQ